MPSRELTLFERVRLARMGGAVERCHTIPHAPGYTNAAHSWGVAMLVLQLWPEDFPRLAGHCICHDVPEGWVGDIPAHTKARLLDLKYQLEKLEDQVFSRLQLPSENDLREEDREKLKAADYLELWLWADEAERIGNHYAAEIRHKLDSWLATRRLPEPAWELYQTLRTRRGAPLPNKGLAMEGY